MTGRLRNSWELTKASWNVLKQDTELLVFPAISGIAVLLVASTFLGGAWMVGLENAFEEGSMLGAVGGFLFYMVTYTVIFFFNSALVGAALIRLDGGDPTVKDGFRIAFDRLGSILAYAVVAATVGMILRSLQERAGVFGKLLGGLGGVAWTLSTYMVVPVLVTRDVDPIQAIKESAALFRKTWGEQMAANIGMGAVTLVATLGVMGLGVVGVVLAAQVAPVLVVIPIVGIVGGILTISLVSSTLGAIYTAALYRFATTGEAPVGFEGRFMREAFAPKG